MSRLYEGCVVVQVVSIVALVGGVFSRDAKSVALSLPSVVHQGQVYRVLLSSFVFADMGQTFYGLLLLYALRQFERLMGLRKFGGFAIVAYLGTVVANLATAALLTGTGLVKSDYVPQPGPYFLIYSALYLYYQHIPRLHASRYTLLNTIVFSEKTWTYLLALHLSLCAGLESLVPSACGLALGAIYHHVPSLQAYRLPAVVERAITLVGRVFSAIIPSMPPAADRRRPGVGAGAGAGVGGGAGATAARAPPPPPPEEAVEALTQLGVDRAAAVRALQQTNNDVQAAANIVFR